MSKRSPRNIQELAGYIMKPKDRKMIEDFFYHGGDVTLDTNNSKIALEFDHRPDGTWMIKGFRTNILLVDFDKMEFVEAVALGNMSQTLINLAVKHAKKNGLKHKGHMNPGGSLIDENNEEGDDKLDTVSESIIRSISKKTKK